MLIVVVALLALAASYGLYSHFRAARETEDAANARDGAPSWGPGGRLIVFAAEVGRDPADLYVMAADGSGRRRLTNTSAIEANPAFSPDGSRIAFESDRDGNSEIYVMDADGGHVQRLTNDPASDGFPAWSPDGTRLAFMSDRNKRAASDIYTMDATDGSKIERLTTDLANWSPQYSPDGKQLAVQVNRDVAVIDIGTKTLRRLTSEAANGMNPTWAPDGQRLAFVTTRNRRAEIFSMNADGTDAKPVVSMPDGSAIDARWSPDGSRLAFVFVPGEPAAGEAQGRQGIYTIDLTTKKITRLSP
jgi:Tol biopolymer transport system component